MDVLRPLIVTVGRRCYRRNPAHMSSHSTRSEVKEDESYADRNDKMYDEDMYDAELNDDFSCDPLELERTRDGYRLVMEVPSNFFGYIIGQKGETKKRIERETQTQVRIPKAQSGIEEITISGKSGQNISSAKTRIDVLVATARKKSPVTHFVSLPLNSKVIMDAFQKFKEQVLENCSHCEGVDEMIFQLPAKLHVTLTTLLLMNQRELKMAQSILEDCLDKVINPILQGSPLLIEVADLEYMNDDPSSVDVLYGKIRMKDGSDKLQRIANGIRDRFVSSPLSKDEFSNENVTLHLTLMNSLFKSKKVDQRSESRGNTRHNRMRETFDASRVLEMFRGVFLGEHHINSIHISEKGNYGRDGFYWPSATISLP